MDPPESLEYVHPWNYFSYVRNHYIARSIGVQVDVEPNEAGGVSERSGENNGALSGIRVESLSSWSENRIRGLSGSHRTSGLSDLSTIGGSSDSSTIWGLSDSSTMRALSDSSTIRALSDLSIIRGSSDSIGGSSGSIGGSSDSSTIRGSSDSIRGASDSIRGSSDSSTIRGSSDSSTIRGSSDSSTIRGSSDSGSEDETLRAVKVETHLGGDQLACTNQGGVLRENKVEIDEAVDSTLSSIPFEVEGMMVHVWNQFDMVFNILADKPLVGCIFLSYRLLKITNQMPNPRVYRWFILVYILLIFVLLMV